MLLKKSVSFITYSTPPHLYSDNIQGIQLLRNSKCHNKRSCIFLLHFSHHLYTLLLLSSPSSPSLAPRRSFRNHTILNKPICRMNNPTCANYLSLGVSLNITKESQSQVWGFFFKVMSKIKKNRIKDLDMF